MPESVKPPRRDSHSGSRARFIEENQHNPEQMIGALLDAINESVCIVDTKGILTEVFPKARSGNAKWLITLLKLASLV